MGKTYSNKIKLTQPDSGNCNWDIDWWRNFSLLDAIVNQLLNGNVVKSGLTPTQGTGLSIDIESGVASVSNVDYTISNQNIPVVGASLYAEEINFVYIDSSGSIQVVQDEPNEVCTLIALVDTDATSILRVIDLRQLQQPLQTIPEPVIYSPIRNEIINGGFNIWQLAQSQTTNGYGSDDRWFNANVGSTKVHSLATFTEGQTDVEDNPKYYSRTVVTSVAGTGNYCNKSQRIENVAEYSGKTVTITFNAKADSEKNIAVELMQYFGSSGSTSVTGIGVSTVLLTANWARYTVSVEIPSVLGKTISGDDDYLQLSFWFDAGSSWDSRTNALGQQSGTFDIANVKLEIGDVYTGWDNRTKTQEEHLCFRYRYHLHSAAATGYSTSSGATLRCMTSVSFPVTMRSIPSFSSANANASTDIGNGTISAYGVSRTGTGLSMSSTSTGSFYWYISSGYLTFNAEL